MKKESSIKINILQKEKRVAELLPEAIAVFAAAGGFSAIFIKAFSIGASPVFGLVIGFAAAICALFSGKRIAKIAPLSASLICLGAVFAVPVLRNGLLVLGNKFAAFLTVATGRIHLPSEVSEESLPAVSLFFLLVAICVLMKNPVFTVSAAVLSITGLLIGFLSTDFWFLLFVFGIVGIVFNVFLPLCGKKTTAKSMASVFAVPIVCVLVCAVLMNFIPTEFGEKILSFTEKTAHSLAFDSKTNAMPEGDFENLRNFERNDVPALEITMEKPQKLYLKGFVGEVYNGMGWEELENEDLAEYAENFYILHQNGFFGQSEVSSALEATGKQEYSAMSITNLSACSKRAYLPYAVSNAGFDNLEIGDANTNSFGKSYEISYISGGLSEWYKAQVELSEKQGAVKATDEHLANEQLYREFVKANYLGITEEAYAAIDNIFADSEAATATEIISEILVCLEKGVTYDEDFSSTGVTDFASFFLEKSARGYSVHYATAATLMLRYFGIPARYAEGYFLPAEEAAEYESGKTIILTENHAHAWAEYYLDGVGWIPFEVTPGYMDDELEKAAFRTDGEGSKRYEQSRLPQTNVEQERPKDDITEAKKDYKILAAAFVCAFTLALISLTVYVIIMRKRLKKALSAIDNADNKTGVAMRFGYAQKLLKNAVLSSETLEICGYSKAFEINREALFSKHPITGEQRKTVDGYAEKVLAECKNKWSFWQKLKNKFVKFIY